MLQARPSASHIWTKCDAFLRLSAQIPEPPPSDPAREGTCAAWVADEVLKGVHPNCMAMVDMAHENGWLVDADMARHVQKYVDHVTSRGGEIHTERKVRLNEMIAGTPDAYAVFDRNGDGTLYVDDLKFGYDIVDPYRNTQVSIYAVAIIIMLERKGVRVRKVVIGIFQPRAIHHDGIYRTWEVWPETLTKFVKDEIIPAAHRGQDVRSTATPGFHCEYCPAAGICSAVSKTIYKGFRVLTDENRTRMTAEELSDEMKFLELMGMLHKARQNAVQTEAKARMKKGEHVPGYGFEPGYGNRRFTVDPLLIKLRTGIDPYAARKVCTPAELIRRGADEKLTDELSEKSYIPPKLVRKKPGTYQKIAEGRNK